jgi:hypothetical protein
MGVLLDRLSTKAPRKLIQSCDLSNLVNNERYWLEEARPDTYTRYERVLKGFRNIGRIAVNTEVEAFIVRDDHTKLAVGMATVILNASVKHPNPEIGVVSGNNLDYWLSIENGQALHKDMAELLVRTGKKSKLTHEAEPFGGRKSVVTYSAVFTAVQTGEINPPIGLMSGIPSIAPNLMLLPFGEPAYLEVPENYDDKHKITAVGQETQLYYLPGGATL